jgi:hypothetical protein
MAQASFTAGGFLLRWVVALALVIVTFNPTPYSYLHWASQVPAHNLPVKFLVGVALLILFVIYLRATWRSIGPLGLVLSGLFFGALIWVAIDYGWLDPDRAGVMTWLGLVVAATILAIGLSWSHVRRRLSGQTDVDDVDER